MAGRKLKPLPDDGHPRTEFVRKLRLLKADEESPTFAQLAASVGYSTGQLSELFNAKRTPSPDLLGDVVTGLGGNREHWLRLLDDLVAAEAALEEAALREGDGTASQIARLTHEVEGLRALAGDPSSAMAAAQAATTAADLRIKQAAQLELGVRSLLRLLQEQTHDAQANAKAIREAADAVLAEARDQVVEASERSRLEYASIIQEAKNQARADVAKIRAEAADELDQMREDAIRLRGQVNPMLDALLAAAEDQLRDAEARAAMMRQEAEAERAETEQRAARMAASMVARAKIEIERNVRRAQQRIEAAGDAESAASLDVLLLDFNIGGTHESSGVRGRHRRQSEVEDQGRPAALAPPG
jgi:hypothetical protein